ncbi:hypothetical protein [Roseivirga sp. UBA838]|uniref:hypothetical protein n=1 Tax=Roseivirga sp. UBA838 TaxID=1947393 RepID=UPI00257B2E60|nr:hypothetical protein [Roseivirga sp. UBA838]|tara:strand:+ start:8345 stop:8689 length:345 start_codon:yes stop_codon:yes gene_type:complete
MTKLIIDVQKVEKIAFDNPLGFTINLVDLSPLKTGIVSAYAATQNAFGKAGLMRALSHAYHHERILGGWMDKKSGHYFYDSCKVFESLEEALKFGREQRQIAIYDLDNDKVIFC